MDANIKKGDVVTYIGGGEGELAMSLLGMKFLIKGESYTVTGFLDGCPLLFHADFQHGVPVTVKEIETLETATDTAEKPSLMQSDICAHMDEWRKEHHGIYKNPTIFWTMFFKEMETFINN